MSAQLIFIPLTSKKTDAGADRSTDDQSQDAPSAGAGSSGGSAAQPATIPGAPVGAAPDNPPWTIQPWIPLPVGTLKVLGQAPNHVGDFDSFPTLFQSLHATGITTRLPGGSNTVFATVEDTSALEETWLREALGRLPSELTIVVAPKSRDAPT